MSEVVASDYVMPEADAERLTNRITLIAGTVREGMEKLYSLVDEAKRGNAHVALGYPSWTAYLADTLGKTPLRLERDERREVVGYLAGEGMSSTAIAPIVGVTDGRVRQIAREVGSDYRPEPAITPPLVNKTTGEILDNPSNVATGGEVTPPAEATATVAHTDRANDAVEGTSPGEAVESRSPTPARPVTGLDGKTYTRPEPTKPRRKPLPEQLQAKAERAMSDALDIKAALDDDRFPSNRDSITELSFNRLRAAALAITDFLAALNPSAVVETEEARDRLVADLNHISETFHRLAQSLQEEPQ